MNPTRTCLILGGCFFAATSLFGCGGGDTTTTATTTTASSTTATTTAVTTTTTSRIWPTPPPDGAPANPYCKKISSKYLSVGTPAVGQPIGWNPTQEKVGQGQWCEVGVPAADWHLSNFCYPPPSAPGVVEGTAIERFLSASTNDAARMAVTVAPARVKVLTYNLFWWNLFGIEKGLDGMAGKNIAQAARDEPFDIMAFQECEDLSWPLSDAKKAGMNESFTMVEWKERATAIAYRTEVFDSITGGTLDVADDGHSQYYGKRGVIWQRLKHKPSGRNVFFIAHHGPTPVNTGGLCGNKGTAYNLLKVIATRAVVGDAVILVGDFNAAYMIANTWNEEIGLLSCHMYHMFSNPTQDDMWGIDNIFASCAELVNRTVLPKGGSDHHALSAVFEI